MIIKHLTDEDFVNYKRPSMFICFPICTWKCESEGGAICQNRQIASLPDLEIEAQTIVERYMSNDISKAFVFGGLEPLDSTNDVLNLIECIRKATNDDIVIYTGYEEDEVNATIHKISKVCRQNLVIKFGKYIFNKQNKFDDVLGVFLASDNQYAKRII